MNHDTHFKGLFLCFKTPSPLPNCCVNLLSQLVVIKTTFKQSFYVFKSKMLTFRDDAIKLHFLFVSTLSLCSIDQFLNIVLPDIRKQNNTHY